MAGGKGQEKAVPFWAVVLALVVVQTGFGCYGPLYNKFAGSAHTNTVVFSFIRDAGCFPVLMMAARVFEGPLVYPHRLKEWLFFAALGFTGMFVGQVMYLLAIYYSSANIASIYQPAMPVWTVLFVLVVGVEKPPPLNRVFGWLKITGILLAAGGAVTMLLAHSNSGEMVNELLGNICALMNTLFFAIYMTLQKKYLFAPMASLATPWRSKPTYVTAWSYLFGAVFMLVGGLVAWAAGLNFMGFGRNGALCSPSNATLVCNPNANLTTSYCDVATHKCRLLTDTFALSTATIGPLIYAVFGFPLLTMYTACTVTSALCYGLISFANRHCATSTATAFWPLQVPVAIVLSYFIFGQVIVAQQIAGGAMIIAGLLCVVGSNKLAEREAHRYQLLVNSDPSRGTDL